MAYGEYQSHLKVKEFNKDRHLRAASAREDLFHRATKWKEDLELTSIMMARSTS